MKSIIRWALNNSPTMNTLMVAVLVVGFASLFSMRRESFPEFDLEIILVSVPYPGASPAEVEQGICQKIEEAVHSLSGIKKQTSIAQEGAGHVVIELETNTKNAQKILNEIRSEVDRIPSFPDLAEDPEVQQITLRQPAIRIGILGPQDHSPHAELQLREIAEQVRNDLLQQPAPPSEFVKNYLPFLLNPAKSSSAISQVNLIGAKKYQIDIEISESKLREHSLTLQQVAAIVRRQNVEIPAGSMKTSSQEILFRGKNKSTVGEGIENIPLVTQEDGVVLTVGDIGTVKDEFTDDALINEVDGQPSIVLSIDRTAKEDLLVITAAVKEYIAHHEMPPGYSLRTWADKSIDVRDRMNLLARNGLQGLLLVFLVLAVFLDLRLAFWVALGIPIAILGACVVLYFFGQTLNMLSMFAFLLALGIVVDDAIVIGENIFAHRQKGRSFTQAAVEGTFEVLPSVGASVITTIIAFTPLLYVSGVMGKFIAVMPIAVIAMLVISLIESIFILPCHLAHEENLFFKIVGVVLYPLKPLVNVFHWLTAHSNRFLERVVKGYYLPALRFSLKNPWLVISISLSLLIFTVGFVYSGKIPFVLMPKLDSNSIQAKIVFPDGTPVRETDRATKRMEEAILKISRKYADTSTPRKTLWKKLFDFNSANSTAKEPLVVLTYRAVGEITGAGAMGPDSRTGGSHVGMVDVELLETTKRNITSDQIIAEWRRETGDIPGAETLTFGAPNMGPGGTPIEFKLLADINHMDQLEAAVEECKKELHRKVGVIDIRDDSRPGKWEFQIKIKKRAEAMGVTTADLAETIRAAYYGEEAMRLQRGRHEVKLMVRYPKEQRNSSEDFDNLRVRIGNYAERPITELADITVERGYAEINRVDQMRSITISADIDDSQEGKTKANAKNIVDELQKKYIPTLLLKYPEVRVRWEGQKEQSDDSMLSMKIGFLISLLPMYVLLTLEFRSYLQPILILMIIPFGAIGAIWGHVWLGLDLSLFSFFGLIALTGVVVNDSIVLMDFINHRIREGMSTTDALLEAGHRRFRPVLLTSITTIAGLLPILLETSFQAQLLIPMAASLSFGLMLTTVFVLFLVPTFYLIYAQIALPAGENIRDQAADFEEIPVVAALAGPKALPHSPD